jgi:hypothetical protein
MLLEPNDVIAKRAFELLANELPSSDFELADRYEIPGKCEIKLRGKKKSVVLVWKSNGKDREVTTRKEYVPIFEKWLSGFEQESKPQYYSQILSSSEILLCTIVENAAEIAREICEVAGVE